MAHFRHRAAFLGLFLLSGAQTAQRTTPDDVQHVLDRAVAYIGEEALTPPARPFRINYRGTTERYAVYQDREPDSSRPTSRFEVLLYDVGGRRSALRYEDAQTDGTQAAWLEVFHPDGGYSLNLKTRLQWPRTADFTATRMRAQAWRIPHLILQELHADPSRLRADSPRTITARHFQVLSMEMNGVQLRILFDDATGALMGYEHDADLLDGTHPLRVMFKEYRPHAQLGRFPAGFVRTIGERVYQDLDVYYVKLSEISETWFETPTNTRTPRVSTTPPSSEQIAPGVTLLRNVGGYNTAVADLGECLAVLDAPEQFSWDNTLPPVRKPAPIGELLLDRIREVSQKPICYVVPTHHHGDHIGAVRSLLREQPTIVTTAGNAPLLQRITRDVLGADAGSGNRVQIVEDRLVLGTGDRSIEIYRITDDPHAGDTLFFYFPANQNVFEADIGDYNQSAKRFLQFIEERGISVARVYGVHNSAFTTPQALETDEPSN
jgi:hypothetical protein